MSLASLEEELYLRSLTAYIVSKGILEGINKLAVITYPDRVCSAMASALVSLYIANNKYKDGSAMIYTYEEGKEKELVDKIMNYDPDAIYISFGGEQKIGYVSQITKNLIKNLKEKGYKKKLLIHVRVWLATKQLKDIISEKDLLDYLKSLEEIRLFTININEKKFEFYKITFEGENIKLNKYSEEKITDEHIALLKKSVPPQ